MVHKHIMKLEDGMFINIRKFKGAMALCADNLQNAREEATLFCIRDRVVNNKKQITLHSVLGRFHYRLKVDAGTLKLEKDSSNNTRDELGDSYWFERVNHKNNRYYGLRSVSEPVLHLCVSGRRISTGDEQKSFAVIHL